MIICIVIVMAIIFGDTATQKYTEESVNELSTNLVSLRDKITQEEIENEVVKEEIEKIYKQWEEKHDKLAYYIEHDELEKVETAFVAMKSYVESEQYEESKSELDKSIFILKHIEDKYDFTLQNVF